VKHEIITWPPSYQTGRLIYPYADAIK
jgi:hypothetical protein